MLDLHRKTGKPTIVGKVRQSQMITTFSVGSMTDFVNQTVVVSGMDKWTWANEDKFKIHNANLQNLLGVKYFVKPKISTKEQFWETDAPDVPAEIFPKWLYNPVCKTLKKANRRFFEHGRFKCYCEKCGVKGGVLLPSRFVLVCPKGHIEDFPYHWWVHEAQEKTCSIDKPELSMFYVGNRTDMDSLFIKCSCGAQRSMKGASARNAFSKYHCSGNRPWLGDSEVCTANEDQPIQMRIRNESSVYFPCTVSALTIPPWSSGLAKELQKYIGVRTLDESQKNLVVGLTKTKFPYIEESAIRHLLDKLLLDMDKGETMQDIMEDEYAAILSYNVSEMGGDFIAHDEDVPEAFNHIIERVVSIDRLTVVTAMVGFTRLTAPTGYNDENLVPISKAKKDWYPGIEQFGEGVFIKFNQQILKDWADKYAAHYIRMGERLENSFFKNERFSPQYVFLHTFSHLFIRELSNLCGYSAASLKERIYSTYQDEGEKMAGVLIYTSASDSDGSLGGLTAQAVKLNLDRILKSMLERGKWCSSDPVCYTSKEQGFMALNYAACFACTLLPETSCEFRNVLLDRCAVCGKPEEPEMGLLTWRKEN